MRNTGGHTDLLHITPYNDNGTTTDYVVFFQVPIPGYEPRGGRKTRNKRRGKHRTSRNR
jgi:hypothetical protein